MNTNQTPNTLEVPALITSILADKDHCYHMLCDFFMSDANKAYAMLVEHGSVSEILQHGSYNEFHGFRERLGGMASAVCYLGNTLLVPRLYCAFILITDILYEDFEDSAVVATLSPDSAVLVNAVVETVQGTTYKTICSECNGVGSVYPLSTVPIDDALILERDYCLACEGSGVFNIGYPAQYLSDSYQSIIESIPLSAYEDYRVVVYHFERVGG